MLNISCASDANLFIAGAINSHSEVWKKIDNIEDYLLRCKKPFNQEDLDKAGYDYAANFNYQKGRSKIEGIVLSNVADLMQAVTFLDIEFRSFNKKKDKKPIFGFLQDEFMKQMIGDELANAFIEAIEYDPNFDVWASTIEYNTFCFGYCPITRDNFTYLGHANHVRSVAFEDRTKLSSINSWICFDALKADFLWRKLKDTSGLVSLDRLNEFTIDDDNCVDIFEDNGWCESGLREIFLLALKNQTFHKSESDGAIIPINTWENIDFVIQKYGLSCVLGNVNNIFIAKLYYFNEDDEFNEVYVATTGDVQNTMVPSYTGTHKHLLYKKNYGKIDQGEVINVIRDYTLTQSEYISELRGSGKIIAEDSLRFDIKKNKIEDKLTIDGLLHISTTNSFQGQSVKLSIGGGVLITEEGVVLNQQKLNLDLNPHILSLNQDQAHFVRETEHLNPSINESLSSRPTKDEVKLKGAEIATEQLRRAPIKLKDYSFALYNSLMDLSKKEFLSRGTKKIQDFFFSRIQDAMVSMDFSKDEIKDIISCVQRISLNPVIKDASAIKEAIQIATSSKARNRLLKQFLVALGFNRRDANNYIEIEDFGTQVSIAALENAAFWKTAEIAFDMGQDHISHLNIHFGKADRVLQGVQQGEDPIQAFTFLSGCLTNTEKHIDAIKSSLFYKNKFKDFYKVHTFLVGKFKQLAALIQKMKQQAAQQQQQQQGQQQQQIDPKVQASIYNDRIKMMDKIKRTNEQHQNNNQRRIEAFQLSQDLMAKSTDNKINISNQLADLKKQLELTKASVDLIRGQQQPLPENATAA